MLVLRVAVVVLVEHARPHLQAAQQAGVHQLGQGAVDRRPADPEAGPLHVVDELVGVEMVVLAEDVAHHVALLFREALRPRTAGQVLPELVFRTLRHFHRWQLHGQSSSTAQRRREALARVRSELNDNNSWLVLY